MSALCDLIDNAKALRQNRPGTVPPNRLETLPVSYRSRPELVHATSAIFAKAFASQGMPEEHTRLTPYLVDEPPGLGPAFEYWPLEARCGYREKMPGQLHSSADEWVCGVSW